MNIEEKILGMSLFSLLQENEGVVVHLDNTAYVVAKLFSDEETQWQITINEDSDLLQQNDRQLVWLHNEPVGNA